MSETLTIFGIDYPNTEGFKAKDDLGTTHTYGEGGGGGNDLPVFTITYDSDDDYSVISATCNKTYSELYSMNQAGTLVGAIENAIIVGSDSYEYSTTLTFQIDIGVPAGGGDDQLPAGEYLWFIRSGSQPLYDVYYGESNTVYIINPSRAAKTLTVTENGNYTPEYGDYSWVEVNVNVSSSSPALQDKTVSYTPSETAQSQTITADNGYDGLDEVSVSVGAISSTYVGTGIARKSSTDLTVSGATVTAPGGYYANAVSKSVTSGSATTPATTVTANPSITVSSAGLIVAINSATQSITPTVSAGYVSSGTAGTITVEGSASSQLSTQAAATYRPSSTDQIISSGKFLTGDQTITSVVTTGLYDGNIRYGATVMVGDTIDNDSVTSVTGTFTGAGSISYGQSAASASKIINGYSAFINGAEVKGNIPSKSSTDLTVSGATVTAPAGYYSSSASTSVASGTAGTPTAAKGTVSNHSISVTPSVTNTTGYITGSTKTGTAVTVSASELVSGSETKTANGTYDVTNLASLVVAVPIVTYYTGSSAPSSSLGSNGDIYLQTS